MIASSTKRSRRERIVQCRPGQEGGFGCRWEDHFAADDGTFLKTSLRSLTQAAQRKSAQHLCYAINLTDTTRQEVL
jgi:hypothetical protein